MLKDNHYRQFVTLFSDEILVTVSDIFTLQETKSGTYEDIDIVKGAIQFADWSSVSQMQKDLRSMITEIWIELKHNIHLVRDQKKYLQSIKKELSNLKNSFDSVETASEIKIRFKMLSILYFPLPPNWTTKETEIFKSTGDKPCYKIDQEKEENIRIRESVWKFSEVLFYAMISFKDSLNDWIEKELNLKISTSESSSINLSKESAVVFLKPIRKNDISGGLTLLRKGLIDMNLVQPTTSVADLRRLFGIVRGNVEIVWAGGLNSLYHFIKELEIQEKIHPLRKNKAKTVSVLFNIADKPDYDFKQFKSNNGPYARIEELRALLSDL